MRPKNKALKPFLLLNSAMVDNTAVLLVLHIFYSLLHLSMHHKKFEETNFDVSSATLNFHEVTNTFIYILWFWCCLACHRIQNDCIIWWDMWDGFKSLHFVFSDCSIVSFFFVEIIKFHRDVVGLGRFTQDLLCIVLLRICYYKGK